MVRTARSNSRVKAGFVDAGTPLLASLRPTYPDARSPSLQLFASQRGPSISEIHRHWFNLLGRRLFAVETEYLIQVSRYTEPLCAYVVELMVVYFLLHRVSPLTPGPACVAVAVQHD